MTLLPVTVVILNQLDEERWSPIVPWLSECKLLTTVATCVFAPERSKTSVAGIRAAGCEEGSGRELVKQNDQMGAVGLVRTESSQNVTGCLSMLKN